jgi:hypothetical protein
MTPTESDSIGQRPRRRLGYQTVYNLLRDYERLSSAERGQLSESELSDRFVEPMFQALGWTVWTAGGIPESETASLDLELVYKDLHIPVEVEIPGGVDPRFRLRRQWLGGWKWGIVTDFETVRIWDLRDPNRPEVLPESGPRAYVTDDDEQHDLLAAEVFYSRVVTEPTRPQSVDFLIRSLDDPNDSVRQRAIEALGEQGDRQAAEHLVTILNDSNQSLRRAAAEALGRIGDPQAVDSLVALLGDSNGRIRQAAVEALGRIGDPRAVDNLVPILSDSNESIRHAAVLALAGIRDSRAIEGLSRLDQDPNDRIRLAAVEAIDSIEQARSERPSGEGQEPLRIAQWLLSDEESKVDLLKFSDYADALADFIRNGKTQKPLVIGVDASWGMGKTTLLYMIKERLTNHQEKRGREPLPVVEFNAWKYDQEESLWAALALQILAQIREQSCLWQRFDLWRELNRRRIKGKELLEAFLLRSGQLLAVGFLGATVFFVALLALGHTVPAIWDKLLVYAKSVGALGLVVDFFVVGNDARRRLAGPFDLKITEYIHKPNYRKRIGFLGEFEKDFAWIVEAVTDDGERPLVVLIDDLDRCAPPKPAEIIEAINLLLDADNCVFVLGMDAQSVAASIEAKYESLRPHLVDIDDPGGLTLGERFLEKILQISFRIPRADVGTMRSFINANLDLLRVEAVVQPAEDMVLEAERLIEEEQRSGRSLDEATQAVKVSRPDLEREAVEEAKQEVFARSFDESRAVQQAVCEAVPYLDFNPRKVKRFINTFRLQALIANRRGLLVSGEIELGLLAKAVVIAMRWPDVVSGVTRDREFVTRLRQAHAVRNDLRTMQAGEIGYGLGDAKELEGRLEVLLSEVRIKRLVDADDLIKLLQDVDAKLLPYYFQLTQRVS